MLCVLPLPYKQVLQCSPLVTNYFITVINAVSNDFSWINTNQTTFTLNDVRDGEVYVVVVVPSSALGSGSAVTTTISEKRNDRCPSKLMQLFF